MIWFDFISILLWFYYEIGQFDYQFSLILVTNFQRNISFNFHDFIINFSLIGPWSIISIFVTLLANFSWFLVDFHSILVDFWLVDAKSIIFIFVPLLANLSWFLVDFHSILEVSTQIHYFNLCPLFSNFVTILGFGLIFGQKMDLNWISRQ